MVKNSFILLILLFCLFSIPTHESPLNRAATSILFDFESEADLDRIYWKCHSFFSLSDDFSSHGRKSLKMELYPSSYPGVTPLLENNDWEGYSYLAMDVFNPAPTNIEVIIRIDDKAGYPNYNDRYNKRFELKSGKNTIKIPIKRLFTSGTNRKMNYRHIERLRLFVKKPTEKKVLYLDNIRLMENK